jgi:hypothetical protein
MQLHQMLSSIESVEMPQKDNRHRAGQLSKVYVITAGGWQRKVGGSRADSR